MTDKFFILFLSIISLISILGAILEKTNINKNLEKFKYEKSFLNLFIYLLLAIAVFIIAMKLKIGLVQSISIIAIITNAIMLKNIIKK